MVDRVLRFFQIYPVFRKRAQDCTVAQWSHCQSKDLRRKGTSLSLFSVEAERREFPAIYHQHYPRAFCMCLIQVMNEDTCPKPKSEAFIPFLLQFACTQEGTSQKTQVTPLIPLTEHTTVFLSELETFLFSPFIVFLSSSSL